MQTIYLNVDLPMYFFTLENYKTYILNSMFFVDWFQSMETGVIGQNMENVQRLVVREHKLVHMSVTILPRNTMVTTVTGA